MATVYGSDRSMNREAQDKQMVVLTNASLVNVETVTDRSTNREKKDRQTDGRKDRKIE